MKRRLLWLAGANIACCAPNVFSVNDDLLAYPQYEIIFSDSYISDKEASSRLSLVSEASATDRNIPSISSEDASTSTQVQTAELSRISRDNRDGTSDQDDTSKRPPDTYERMILDSRPYLCSVPQPPAPPPVNTTSMHKAAEEEAAELVRATDRGWELLQEMTGSCLYFISGWWSYAFCYADSVKQFHQLPPGKGGAPPFPPVEDPTTPSYILGRFGERRINAHRSGMGGSIGANTAEKEAGLDLEDRSGDTTQVQAKGSSSSRYLSQKLSGGTTCDLTGQPRRVEVQFHCHPQSADRIGWIREISTCSYLIMVYTPRLCNDVAFSPPREDKAEQIVCQEVLTDDDEEVVSEWRARKRREAETKLVSDTAEAAKVNLPIIGGTVVGGMKNFGHEGRRLELPQNWQQQQQQGPGSHGHGNMPQAAGSSDQAPSIGRVELVAKQDPQEAGGRVQRLSDEQLRKLGIDLAVVDAARKRLDAMVGKQRWRLEAIAVQGGWEMRAIVEGDDEEGEYLDEYTFEEVEGEEGNEDGGGGDGEAREYRDEL